MPVRFTLVKCTDKSLAYTNCVFLHPEDMTKLGAHDNDHVVIDEVLTHRVRTDPKLQPGQLGTSNLNWQALHLDVKSAVGKMVTVDLWDKSKQAASRSSHDAHTITLVVDTYAKKETPVDAVALEKHVRDFFHNEVFSKDQRWIFKWQNTFWLGLRVANVYLPPDSAEEKAQASAGKGGFGSLVASRFGRLKQGTVITLVAASNRLMNLVQPKIGGNLKMSGPDWDPERMGIGGLDAQFGVIFRRAFASRLYPADIVEELGIKHVKGMLLYGPPGTGKTLIARSIGSMLTDNEPKVVNGPEILNKYVGASEENIRNLFAEARAEQDEKGAESGLHIIIFDEIDAICKQRGSMSSGTGVHDTVVNQLLSMIDGVDALNNVLVIGMTNRKDLLDQALLRAGRLEVHVEIGLPNEQGREQIFRIHTRRLREHGYLHEDVSLAELAKRTKNYSGAEIEGVVRSAISFAMQRHIDVDNVSKMDLSKMRDIMITQEYLEYALDEVKPEFGLKDEDLEARFARGVFTFSPAIDEIHSLGKRVVQRMRASAVMRRQAILLRGELGVGKTALASKMAFDAEFPFVRVVSADDFVGATDGHVTTVIGKTFDDSYKSDLSVIILDDLERLIGYTIGPRFSNPILQTLLTCIRRTPPHPGRKILVVATCTAEVARTLGLERLFDFVRDVPKVSDADEFRKVLEQSGALASCADDATAAAIVKQFDRPAPICDVLTVLELATDQDTITQASFASAWRTKFRHKPGAYGGGADELMAGFEALNVGGRDEA